MKRRTTFAVIAAAVLVVLAGCSGDVTDPSPSDSTEAESGTMNFYVSDEQNAIDQFEHVNATITEIGIHRKGGDNETGAWIERDVNATVDLTELQGARSTKLDEFGVESGSYNKVFIYVSAIEGTLKDGSSAEVKLPSDKLRLNKAFTVAAGETVSFVYDVTVFERGNSGYILKPVAGESGTGDEVEIDPVEENESADATLDAAFRGNVTRGENATVEVTSDGATVENATLEAVQNDTTTEYTTDANGTATVPVDENAAELVVTVTYQSKTVELSRTFDDGDVDSTDSENGQGKDTGDGAGEGNNPS